MSYGCDGMEVDRRTQQSHALEDRTAQGLQQADALKEVKDILLQKATEATGHVVQDQLDIITCHLATTTLSDVASSSEPPALSSSGIDSASPMYSSSQATGHVIQDQLDTITRHLATTTLSDVASSPEPTLPSSGIYSAPVMCSSSQARTHRLLKCLSEIETSVNVLDAEVTTQLYHSELPSFLDSQSFPLASLVGKCHLLDADLLQVTSKSAAVTAAKDTIENQLDVIARKLQAAKKTWMERQDVMRSSRPTKCTTQYSTGHVFPI